METENIIEEFLDEIIEKVTISEEMKSIRLAPTHRLLQARLPMKFDDDDWRFVFFKFGESTPSSPPSLQGDFDDTVSMDSSSSWYRRPRIGSPRKYLHDDEWDEETRCMEQKALAVEDESDEEEFQNEFIETDYKW